MVRSFLRMRAWIAGGAPRDTVCKLCVHEAVQLFIRATRLDQYIVVLLGCAPAGAMVCVGVCVCSCLGAWESGGACTRGAVTREPKCCREACSTCIARLPFSCTEFPPLVLPTWGTSQPPGDHPPCLTCLSLAIAVLCVSAYVWCIWCDYYSPHDTTQAAPLTNMHMCLSVPSRSWPSLPVEPERNALEGWGVHCVQRAEPCSATQWCHPFSARARGLLGARLVTRYANCASTGRCSCPSVLLAWARIQSGFLGVLPRGRWCVWA